MKISRRRFVRAGSALAIAAPFSGIPSVLAAQDNPTIKYWLESDASSQWIIDNTIAAFNEKGGPKVDATIQPETWTATQTALAGGAGPDAVLTPGPTFAVELAKAGQIVALDDYVAQYGWADIFQPWALELGRVDGKLYSIPSEIETVVLYYNKTLFEEQGWTPPTTIDELVALADTVHAADIVPFSHSNAEWRPTNEHYLGEFLNHGAGPDNVYKALTGELPWTDEVFAQALAPLNDFQAKGYFSGGLDRYYTTTTADTFANLAYGDAAMKIDGSWAMRQLPEYFEESGMEWDWVPMPSKDGSAIFDIGIGSTYSINANSKFQDAVAEFYDYYFQPETQASMTVGSGIDPAPVMIDPSLLSAIDERHARLITQLGDAAASGNYGYTTWTFFPPKTQVFMYEEIEKVWAGNMTVEEYLGKAEEIFADDLKSGRVPPIPARS